MSHSKIIAFSGGCHSGKTTSMNIIKKILEQRGKKVFFLSELIRKMNISSIDDIRKDANKYVDMQYEIITGRIDAEIHAYNNFNEDVIFLLDRAITDSLFYLTFYVNKSDLDNEHIHKFGEIYNILTNYLNNYRTIYTYVLEFTPITKIVEQDSYRPASLDVLQPIEYSMIKTYNTYYYNILNDKYKQIDLNSIAFNDMESFFTYYVDTVLEL